MLIQVYTDQTRARIYYGNQSLLAELPAHTTSEADGLLHLLGWQRKRQWEKTYWGWQAELRRKP